MTAVFPLAEPLAGLLLLCAFVLLGQRRLHAMITIYQMQAWVLAAAAFTQGFAQHSSDLFLTGIITLSVNAVLLPMALRRIMRRLKLIRAIEPTIPAGLSMILGVVLIGIAVSLARGDLAIALSVVLLGLAVMTTRRNALSQVIGLLSSGNGLVLAAILAPNLPFVAALSVALLVLLALFVGGVFMFQLREEFDTLDLSSIEATRNRGR